MKKFESCAQKLNSMREEQLFNFKQQERQLLQTKLTLLKGLSFAPYQPHAKQEAFHAAGKLYKERLFLAGNRCGKTYAAAQEMAMHLTGEYPDWWQGLRFEKPIHAWAASVTVESTRDILQKAYLGDETQNVVGAIPQGLLLDVTMRRGVSGAIDTVYVRHKTGAVSMLGFKSYDQGREKFQGTSRDFIHLDEEPDILIYEECLLRTLDRQGSIILTMTPLKGMTDICMHYLQDETDTKKVIQASWEDTNHLSEEELLRLKKSLRPHEREAREKGVPSLGSGRIYPVEESDITVAPFDIPESYKRVFGLDFGWTNPTAVVWGAYHAEEDILYIYDCYAASELSPAEHCVNIKHKGDWIPGVCDPAGQSASQGDGISLIEHYARQGVQLTKADNGVESGLMEMLDRMQTGRLKVFSNLTDWWREFRLYRRDEKGQVVKRHDHLMDATRYLVNSGIYLSKLKQVNKKKIQRDNHWSTV